MWLSGPHSEALSVQVSVMLLGICGSKRQCSAKSLPLVTLLSLQKLHMILPQLEHLIHTVRVEIFDKGLVSGFSWSSIVHENN